MNKFPKFFVVCFCSIFFLLGSNFFIYSKLDGKNKNEIIVGYSQLKPSSLWEKALTNSIINEAKVRNINLRVINLNDNKPENQKEDIRFLIKKGVDIIVFKPIVNSGWIGVLHEAKGAGIPVIVVDFPINETDDSLWVTFIQNDFFKQGQLAAEWLVENYKKINENSKNIEKINIVELRGDDRSYVSLDRGSGFYNILKEYPDFNIIESESGGWMRQKGEEIMNKLLKKHDRNIHVIFSHNDDMALGAIDAISMYGLTPGKDIIIVSIDGVKGAFNSMIL